MTNLKLIYGNIIDKLKNQIAENEKKHEAALEKEREAAHFVVRRLEDAIKDIKEAINQHEWNQVAEYKEGEDETR